MNRRGFTPMVVLFVLVGVLIAIGVVWYYKSVWSTSSSQQQTSSNPPPVAPLNQVDNFPIPQSQSSTKPFSLLACDINKNLTPLLNKPLPKINYEIVPGFDYVDVKFSEGTCIRLRNGQFVSLNNTDITPLFSVLKHYQILKVSPDFSASEAELDALKLRAEKYSGQQGSDLNLFYNFYLKNPSPSTMKAFIDDLNALSIVESVQPLSSTQTPPPPL
jgi:hypothetical protein